MEKGEVYHVMNKSIERYVIFNNETEYLRMQRLIQYYQIEDPPMRFSYFMTWWKDKSKLLNERDNQNKEKLIRVIAYCLMPTHIHLVLEELKDKGISIYVNRVLNSYSRYFNTKHHRKGPLWTGRFKRIRVKTDEQLIHLTRYVHLNPATAYLVNIPELWQFSSYHEYLGEKSLKDRICEFNHLLEIDHTKYKKFVEDQISYQRELAAIKDLILE